jgi:hypothetical protein
MITSVAQGNAEITNSFRLAGTTEEDKSFADEAIEILMAGADVVLAGQGERA